MSQNVHVEFTSDHQKVLSGLAKTNAALQTQVAQLRKIDRAGGRASKSVTGIGASAVRAMAGFASLHQAIAKVNQALRQQVELRRATSGRIESQEENLKRLIQISGGDPVKLAGLKATAAGLVRNEGINANEAAGLVFTGASRGFSNEEILQIGEFKRFAKNIGPLFDAIGGLQAAFGNTTLGGTARGAMNALLAAAETSNVSVEMLAGQALTSAQDIKMKLGGTAAETLAALGLLSKALKSPEEAATALGAFARATGTDKRFAGKGLIAAFETMEGLSPAQREKVVGGEVRGGRALALLENMDALRRVYADVQRSIATTGAGDRTGRAIALAESSGLLPDLTFKQRAREAAKLTMEDTSGRDQLRREAIQWVIEQMMETQGRSTMGRYLVRSGFAIREFLGLDPLGVVTEGMLESKRGRAFQEKLGDYGYTYDLETGGLKRLGPGSLGTGPEGRSEQIDETNRLLESIEGSLQESSGALVVSGEPLE